MNKKEISKLYRAHLLKSVGKSPSKTRIKEIELLTKNLEKQKNFSIKRLYDKEYSPFWKEIVAYENKSDEIILFQRYIKPPQNGNMASLASGIAIFEMFLAKKFVPMGRVYCVDFSKRMNEKARKFKKKLKIKNVSIITSSVSKTTLRKNSQNVVIARRTGLSKGNQWNRVLKEVNRILRKNSESRFVYTTVKDRYENKKKIKYLLNKAHLDLVDITSFKDRGGDIILMVIAKPIMK